MLEHLKGRLKQEGLSDTSVDEVLQHVKDILQEEVRKLEDKLDAIEKLADATCCDVEAYDIYI